MAEIIIALGSNLGDRRQHLSNARSFLSNLSDGPIRASAIYETEPIGPSEYDFYNAVIQLSSSMEPFELLERLKTFELQEGRNQTEPRWSARILDLDIIDFGHASLHDERLRLPHPEYRKRLFVLTPLQEIRPDWQDPETGETVEHMIRNAPSMRVSKTGLNW